MSEGYQLKELIENPTPGTPVGRMTEIEHARSKREDTMGWPDPGENPAVKTTIKEDNTESKGAAKLWANEKESMSGASTRTWWTDGLRTVDKG
jgi:hypothetical protein